MALRVDDDDLRAAASRWRALAAGLTSGATLDVSGLSSQASALVVNEIHAGAAVPAASPVSVTYSAKSGNRTDGIFKDSLAAQGIQLAQRHDARIGLLHGRCALSRRY
jgi:hypothetical protein